MTTLLTTYAKTDTSLRSPLVDEHNVWLGLPVRPELIPEAIKHLDQWVVWKAEPKAGGGMNKVPYTVQGHKASSINPSTWTDYYTALAGYQEDDSGWDGLGFMVRKETQIILLDFDHVRSGHTGVIDANVLAAIRRLGTYAEVSPSGTGIRVIGFGTLERAITTPRLQGWVTGRYVTVTGHRLDEAPGELRPIDPRILAEIVAYFTPASQAAPLVSTAGSAAPLPASQCLEIRQALGYLDPDQTYDQWLQVGMALHSTGAANAFGLWHEWSATGAKFDAKVLRDKWGSFKDNGQGVQLASLFKRAMDAGWVNGATREARAFAEVTGQTLAEANRKAPELTVVAPAESQLLPFPVSDLNAIADWITAGAAVSYPVITQQAVLCLVGAAAARLYVTPQGDPLSLYLGAAARTVGELRYAHHAVRHLLAEAGLMRMIRATRFTSPQTIYKTLIRSPAALYLSDDYGGLSAFARRQPSGLQEQALATLAACYDGKPIQLDGPEEAGIRRTECKDEQPVIQAPALSLFALVGHDHLATLLRASELGRGALEQLLLAIGDDDAALVRDPDPAPPPVWVADQLRAIRNLQAIDGLHHSLVDIFNGNAETLPSPQVVPFQVDLTSAYAALDAVSSERLVRPLLLAARGILRRIAAGLAVWRHPGVPVVDAALLDWSLAYVRGRMLAMVEQFEILHGSDGKASVYDTVLAKILEEKQAGLTRGNLPAYVRAYRNLTNDKRTELVEQMLADGVIFEVTIKSASGAGRPSKRLVAAKFVCQDKQL
jgi:hypothetical protein